MKKNILICLSVFLFCFANAQDTIVLRSGINIRAKVVSVEAAEIRYKKFENPSGPDYVVNTSGVEMIKYENGSNDIFTPEREKELQKTAASKGSFRKKSWGAIYAALSIPLGSFEAEKEGGAQLGWGVGLQGASTFTGGSAYFSFQLSYANHPYEFNGYINGYHYLLKGDYNVWHLLAGFGTQGQPASAILYMNIMGGLNYTSLSGSLHEAGYSDAVALAVCFGTGVIISNRVNIGLKYMYSNGTFKNSNSSSFDAEQKISMFQITGGIQL